MFNLLHMDLRRMATDKAFWVNLTILIAVMLFLCSMLAITSNEDSLVNFAAMGGKITVNGETITDPELAQAELAAEAAEAQAELAGMNKAQFFYQFFSQGGALSVFMAILSTLFVCADFSSGFVKNIFSVRNRGLSYIAAKAVTLTCATAAFISILFVLAQICFWAFRLPLASASAAEYISYLLQAWVMGSAFAIQNLFFCVWLRSIALGITLSFVCGGGVAAMLLQNVLRLFGFDPTPYLIFGTMTNIGITLQGTVVCLAWSAFYLALAIFILRKKDI